MTSAKWCVCRVGTARVREGVRAYMRAWVGSGGTLLTCRTACRNVAALVSQGYRAGYVAGAFMIGRLLSSTVWGVWSDSHGRKPVLYAGCVTIAVTSIAFGLSFSYWWMLLVRFLGGVGNGITSTAKTCTSEVAHEAHQARGTGTRGDVLGTCLRSRAHARRA